MLDEIEPNKGDAEVDAVENHLSDERVDLDRLEDRCPVVEEVICACQLLEHLKQYTQGKAITIEDKVSR